MRRTETRYARVGGLHVAYQITGRGLVDLLLVSGVVSHLDLWWQLPGSVALAERLESACRLIRYDGRGTGLSDRPPELATLDDQAEDIRAVMDAAGSARAVIYASGFACAVACAFAARYPERVMALILHGPSARQVRNDEFPWGLTPERYAERVRQLEEDWPPDWYVRGAEFEPDALALRRYFRAAASPGAASARYGWYSSVDLRDLLPSIHAPTLVFSTLQNEDFAGAARDVAARLPGARFHGLEDDADVGSSLEELLSAGLEFLRHQSPQEITSPSTRVVLTILCLDIVESTARLAAVGDRAWRVLLDRFYGVVQDELAMCSGHEIDRAGDGILASFETPYRAISCAIAIQGAARALGLLIRAGVHTGEVEQAEGKVRGLAVHIAARVAALARGDEILVTSTVRELAAGSGLEFTDRGVHELKGVPQPRQVFQVRP